MNKFQKLYPDTAIMLCSNSKFPGTPSSCTANPVPFFVRVLSLKLKLVNNSMLLSCKPQLWHAGVADAYTQIRTVPVHSYSGSSLAVSSTFTAASLMSSCISADIAGNGTSCP